MNRITFPMLTLGLSLAPVLCWAAEPNADQAKAIAEIEKLGGKVTVDEKSPGKPVIAVDLAEHQVTDAGTGTSQRLDPTPIAGPGGHQGDRRWAGTSQRVDPTPIAEPGVHQGDRRWAGASQRIDPTPIAEPERTPRSPTLGWNTSKV